MTYKKTIWATRDREGDCAEDVWLWDAMPVVFQHEGYWQAPQNFEYSQKMPVKRFSDLFGWSMFPSSRVRLQVEFDDQFIYQAG
jgi:hypothetical protein